MKNSKIYIGLGSNTGNTIKNLHTAVEQIEKTEHIWMQKLSSIYITKPWGKTDQDDFVNQVIEIETLLSPVQLLSALQNIEIKMGRQRIVKWGPRNIDLDIILYGSEIIHSPELIIPHPYAQQRLFVLIPLQEINPGIVFPDSGRPIREVLDRVIEREGKNGIKKLY